MARSRGWCFTDNECNEDVWTNAGAEYLVFGREVAPSTGHKHLQGYIYFKQPKGLKGMKKLHATAHFEPAKGTSKQNRDYCVKDNNFVEIGELPQQGKRADLEDVAALIKEGASLKRVAEEHPTTFVKFYKGIKELKRVLNPITPLQDYVLRPWQAKLEALVKGEPDPRQIMWYTDQVGAAGKSWMAQFLMCNYGADVYDGGKTVDILYLCTGARVQVFDLSRPEAENAPYTAIEHIKNGLVVSTKYEPERKKFPPPHVIVFSNSAPDLSKFSMDRWDFIELRGEDE